MENETPESLGNEYKIFLAKKDLDLNLVEINWIEDDCFYEILYKGDLKSRISYWEVETMLELRKNTNDKKI